MAKSAKPKTETSQSPRGRRPVNLTLDRDAVERGERFANRHGVSVSTLVSGFLQSLPDEDSAAASFSPAVKRLYGVAAGNDFSRDLHREFLANKYGVKWRWARGRRLPHSRC